MIAALRLRAGEPHVEVAAARGGAGLHVIHGEAAALDEGEGAEEEGEGAHAGVLVREILLERVDGEERLVRFLLRGSHEVEVDEHLDLEGVLRDVHHDGCEKV